MFSMLHFSILSFHAYFSFSTPRWSYIFFSFLDGNCTCRNGKSNLYTSYLFWTFFPPRYSILLILPLLAFLPSTYSSSFYRRTLDKTLAGTYVNKRWKISSFKVFLYDESVWFKSKLRENVPRLRENREEKKKKLSDQNIL